MTLPSYSVEFLLVERRLFERRLLQKNASASQPERRRLHRRIGSDAGSNPAGPPSYGITDRAA